MDVGGTTAHTLGELHRQIRVLLDERLHHAGQDELLSHGLGGHLDSYARLLLSTCKDSSSHQSKCHQQGDCQLAASH